MAHRRLRYMGLCKPSEASNFSGFPGSITRPSRAPGNLSDWWIFRSLKIPINVVARSADSLRLSAKYGNRYRGSACRSLIDTKRGTAMPAMANTAPVAIKTEP